jgi:hypothetical protein
LLEDNVSDMLPAKLWDVPGFRVTGGTIEEPYLKNHFAAGDRIASAGLNPK